MNLLCAAPLTILVELKLFDVVALDASRRVIVNTLTFLAGQFL